MYVIHSKTRKHYQRHRKHTGPNSEITKALFDSSSIQDKGRHFQQSTVSENLRLDLNLLKAIK